MPYTINAIIKALLMQIVKKNRLIFVNLAL